MSNILLLELADINAPPLIRYTIKLIDNKILTIRYIVRRLFSIYNIYILIFIRQVDFLFHLGKARTNALFYAYDIHTSLII